MIEHPPVVRIKVNGIELALFSRVIRECGFLGSAVGNAGKLHGFAFLPMRECGGLGDQYRRWEERLVLCLHALVGLGEIPDFIPEYP